MENIGNLEHLEKAVDNILRDLKELKLENLSLADRVASRDQEISTLKEKLEGLQGERNQIHQRVAGLINSIDKWEKLNESQPVPEATGAGVEEKKLF